MGDENSATGKQALGDAVSSRRAFMTGGSAVAVGVGALAMAAPAAAQENKSESLLDKWARTKVAVVGMDLASPPLRYRDASGKPTGFGVELMEAMLRDIGCQPEYVEIPFGQTFAALAAGRCELMGQFATMLPGRALRGAFAGFPAHYQVNVAYVKPGSKAQKLSDLNVDGVTIAVDQGTSESALMGSLFPKAKVLPFPQMPDAISAVGSGRADVLITDPIFAPNIFKPYPDVRILAEVVNQVPNTYFMPHNDFKLWSFITSWLRYQASQRLMLGLFVKFLGTELQEKYGLPLVTVGSGGEPFIVKT